MYAQLKLNLTVTGLLYYAHLNSFIVVNRTYFYKELGVSKLFTRYPILLN